MGAFVGGTASRTARAHEEWRFVEGKELCRARKRSRRCGRPTSRRAGLKFPRLPTALAAHPQGRWVRGRNFAAKRRAESCKRRDPRGDEQRGRMSRPPTDLRLPPHSVPERAGRALVAVPGRGRAVADLRRDARSSTSRTARSTCSALYGAYTLIGRFGPPGRSASGAACCWRRSPSALLGALIEVAHPAPHLPRARALPAARHVRAGPHDQGLRAAGLGPGGPARPARAGAAGAVDILGSASRTTTCC